MLDYRIVTKDQKRLVYLPDPPQYLDACDVWMWMVETRDEDSDLYAEIVQMYFKLKKTYTKEEE
jgi:hypothetical protein